MCNYNSFFLLKIHNILLTATVNNKIPQLDYQEQDQLTKINSLQILKHYLGRFNGRKAFAHNSNKKI